MNASDMTPAGRRRRLRNDAEFKTLATLELLVTLYDDLEELATWLDPASDALTITHDAIAYVADATTATREAVDQLREVDV